MKKILLLNLWMIVISVSPALGQTNTTVYTPKGTAVSAIIRSEFSQETIDDINEDIMITYPNAVLLDDASRTYNCHGYAWHLTEGHSNRVWMNSPNDDIYWNDGSFVEVCNISDATKISYYAGDHSAVKSVAAGKYDSKWGELPLMRHSPTYVPSSYNPTYRKYYASTEISGPGTICGSTVFSARNITGATYSWSKSSNLTLSGSGRSRTATPTPGASGAAWVQVTITTPCGGPATRRKNITIDTGSPTITADYYTYNYGPPNPISVSNNPVPVIPAYVEAFFTLSGETNSNIQIIGQSDPSIVWGTASGPGSLDFWFDFTDLNQWITFRVTATNPCGTDAFDVTFYTPTDFAEYMISPNPASDNVNISVIKKDDETISFRPEIGAVLTNTARKLTIKEVAISNIQGIELQRKKFSGNVQEANLNISDLPDGIYFLEITDGKYKETKRIVVAN